MLGTCRAAGDIDRSNASAFDIDLRDAIDNSDEALVSVDCSAVTFMDSAGYRMLVEASAYAVRRGHTLVIRDMSPSCALMIRLCDPDHELRTSDEPREYPAHQRTRNELCTSESERSS